MVWIFLNLPPTHEERLEEEICNNETVCEEGMIERGRGSEKVREIKSVQEGGGEKERGVEREREGWREEGWGDHEKIWRKNL